MATAYVLINCDLGYEEQIIEELKHISDVKEVNGVFGAYDILAKVESDQIRTLRETIMSEIRKIRHVRSTLTLMGIENQE
ncbi:MAG: AsnC family transcription regulator [Nitrosopumilales archaeon]|nr:MAG: AsnC family transcription regulator [Nitrosopumilales archaeon]MCH8973162.1 Lrp/AsnC ligand binding domain-containing protein [Nitrososphaerota archaeon]